MKNKKLISIEIPKDTLDKMQDKKWVKKSVFMIMDIVEQIQDNLDKKLLENKKSK